MHRSTVWILLVGFLTSAITVAAVTAIALDHNPQGEFNQGTIQWQNLLPLLLSWALVSLATAVGILFMLRLFYRIIKRQQK